MKPKENKKYYAHSKRRKAGNFTIVGFWLMAGSTISNPSQFKINLLLFFIFIALDVIIFVIQYSMGRYARVSFNNDGFIYIKYSTSEFVPWNKVVEVEEVLRFSYEARYYLIKVTENGRDKDYLLEKNHDIKEMMEKYYFHDSSNDKKLRLPFFREQIFEFSIAVYGLALVALLYLAGLEHKDIISPVFFTWAAAIICITTVALTFIFFHNKRNMRYKISRQGVRFKFNDKELTINWDDSSEVIHKAEYIYTKEYHILSMKLKEALAGIYDTIEVPVTYVRLEKLRKFREVVSK